MSSRCEGQHTWQVVKEIKAIETYTVTKITDGDDTTILDPLGFEGDLFPVVIGDGGDSETTEVTDEYLGCKYCPAEIRGERLQEVEYQ